MKKEYNLLVLKALEFFIENPYEEIHLREFARRMKLSANSAQRFLNLFVKKEFIKEERRANLRYFKANLESLVFKQIKITHSMDCLVGSGLISYLEERFISVILFGSVAKGLDDYKSDIDLVCIGNKKELEMEKYEAKLRKEVNLHVFTLAEWKKQKKENLAFYEDVIIEGINLFGEKPVVE